MTPITPTHRYDMTMFKVRWKNKYVVVVHVVVVVLVVAVVGSIRVSHPYLYRICVSTK